MKNNEKVYREKTVFAVVVTSKHFLSDIFQGFRNLLGMQLVAYEDMIAEAIEKGLYKINKTYPSVYDIRIATSMVTQGAAEIIIYGKIKEEIKND